MAATQAEETEELEGLDTSEHQIHINKFLASLSGNDCLLLFVQLILEVINVDFILICLFYRKLLHAQYKPVEF